MDTPKKLYRADSTLIDVVETTTTDGRMDAGGETIYMNVHFDTEAQAWEKLEREVSAGMKLAGAAVVEAERQLAKARAQAGVAATEWLTFCKRKDKYVRKHAQEADTATASQSAPNDTKPCVEGDKSKFIGTYHELKPAMTGNCFSAPDCEVCGEPLFMCFPGFFVHKTAQAVDKMTCDTCGRKIEVKDGGWVHSFTDKHHATADHAAVSEYEIFAGKVHAEEVTPVTSITAN